MNDVEDKKDFSIGDSKNPLRLLIMDSMSKTAEQTTKLVREIGYVIKPALVKEIEELEKAIDKHEWDLILIPPRLADSNASQALTFLARTNKDIPLVILSSDHDDPLVVNALQSGARDVVDKENTDRFRQIIRRELEDLSQRRARHYYEKLYKDYKKRCEFLTEQSTNMGGNGSANLATLPATNASAPEQEITPHDKTEQLNQQDLLAGHYTRQYFIDKLKQTFSSELDNSVVYGLLYLKIDNFKDIREQAGVAISDSILSEFGKLLHQSFDETITVAHYDDHTFTTLINRGSIAAIKEFADNIRKKIGNHTFPITGQTMSKITCSIGISTINEATNNAQKLITNAQISCQIATSKGGNNTHVYNPKQDLDIAKEKDKDWHGKIRHALENDRFRLVYMPIVGINPSSNENYEVLVRMLEDDGSDILPGKFFSAANQSKLLPALDRWIVEHAINELAKRCQSGIDTNFFIKLCGDTVNDNNFPSWLSNLMDSAKLPSDKVVFEFSEPLIHKNYIQAKKFINWLKVLNFRCAIEHFGTHENSLEAMKDLSVDFMKLDRSFMHDLANNKAKKAMIKSIIGTAHSLDKFTIAEFVQNASSLSVLWQCGVDYIQGYFLQRPDATMNYDFSEF